MMRLSFVLVLSGCTLISSYTLDKQVHPVPKAKFVRQLASLNPIPLPERQDIPPIPKYSSGCSNVDHTFTAAGQQAVLTSQNYPGNYPPNSDCSYFFTSPAGTTMSVTCDIKISCNNGDYIYFSTSGDGYEDIAYCGTGTTPEIDSDSNELSIGFYSEPYSLWGTGYNYRCVISVSGGSGPTTTPSPSTTTQGPTTTSPPGSCSCGVRNPDGATGTKIVGGTQTKTGELPWRVSVYIQDPSTGSGGICGGTIISKNWVMTAAHCTMDFKSGMKIIVYTEAQANPITVGGGVSNAVDRYVQHPQFNRDTMNNDITLLHLATPLTFKSNVSPACLPWNMVSSDFSGINVLASGWGTTKPVPVGVDNTDSVSNTLLEVTLPVLSTSQCQQYLSTQVNQNNICTYLPGKDTCQGDSGGSIDYQGSNSFYYSIGVVSWGFGCAQKDNPGVYTKVTNYLSWIQTTSGDNFCKI